MADSDLIAFRGDDVTFSTTLDVVDGTDFYEITFSVKKNIDDDVFCFQATKTAGTVTYDVNSKTVTVPISSDFTKDWSDQLIYDIETKTSTNTDITTRKKGYLRFWKDVTTN